MKSFSAFRHVDSNEIRFVGDSWADGGVHVDDAGQPVRDAQGNTIARHSITEIDERDADLLAAAYSGDETPERGGFLTWLVEQGVPAQVSKAVADQACR